MGFQLKFEVPMVEKCYFESETHGGVIPKFT